MVHRIHLIFIVAVLFLTTFLPAAVKLYAADDKKPDPGKLFFEMGEIDFKMARNPNSASFADPNLYRRAVDGYLPTLYF